MPGLICAVAVMFSSIIDGAIIGFWATRRYYAYLSISRDPIINNYQKSQAPSSTQGHLVLHHLHQPSKAIHHVVLHVLWCVLLVDGVKELTGAADFRFFNLTQFHRRHRALGFSNEVNVLHRAFFKRNSPVWVVIAYRCRNQEASRQLGVHHHIGTGIQLLHELAFNVGVGNHIVVNVALQWFTGMGEILLSLASS